MPIHSYTTSRVSGCYPRRFPNIFFYFRPQSAPITQSVLVRPRIPPTTKTVKSTCVQHLFPLFTPFLYLRGVSREKYGRDFLFLSTKRNDLRTRIDRVACHASLFDRLVFPEYSGDAARHCIHYRHGW